MSYILDALRRAEAERERGQVPGLHTQARPLPDMADDEPPARGRPTLPTWAWMVGALLLVALGLVAWRPWATPGTAGDSAPVATTIGGPVNPSSDAATTISQAPPPVSPPPMAAAPAPVAPAMPMPRTPPAPAPMPARPAVITSPPAQRAVPAPPMPQAAQSPQTTPMPLQLDPKAVAPTSGTAAASAPAERVPRLAELPDALRRELPALSFGGSIHSPDPFARMLIVNGQVRREGDGVAPGLTLVRIRAGSAVFEYKGRLFEIAF